MLEYRSKPHSGLDLAVTAARSSAPALPGPLHLRRDCRCCAGPVDFVRGPLHRDVSLQLKGFEVRSLLKLDGFFLQVIRFNQHSADALDASQKRGADLGQACYPFHHQISPVSTVATCLAIFTSLTKLLRWWAINLAAKLHRAGCRRHAKSNRSLLFHTVVPMRRRGCPPHRPPTVGPLGRLSHPSQEISPPARRTFQSGPEHPEFLLESVPAIQHQRGEGTQASANLVSRSRVPFK
jgi:hypothetical protein